MSELTTIEDLAVRLVDLLELRYLHNDDATYHALGVYELCAAIKAIVAVPFPEPTPEPLVHYTDHHGGTVCGIAYNTVSFNATEARSKVTCPECATIKPEARSTWPIACPQCNHPWAMRSKTMGAQHGQPHRGTCQNNHRWFEGHGMVKSYSATMNESPVPLDDA